MPIVSALRTIREFALNALIAALGTAVIESPLFTLSQPQTMADAYRKELVLSATVAFLLGGLVFYMRRTGASQWVWILGIIGFAWRILRGNDPHTLDAFAETATLAWISVRFVAYSAGAVICSVMVMGAVSPSETPQQTQEP